MTGLVLANIYRPGAIHHGNTVVIRDDDPTGDVAYSEALVRFSRGQLEAMVGRWDRREGGER